MKRVRVVTEFGFVVVRCATDRARGARRAARRAELAERIRPLREQDIPRNDAAALLGLSTGSLGVYCRLLGIDLFRKPSVAERPRRPGGKPAWVWTPSRLARLEALRRSYVPYRQCARRMDTTVGSISSALLRHLPHLVNTSDRFRKPSPPKLLTRRERRKRDNGVWTPQRIAALAEYRSAHKVNECVTHFKTTRSAINAALCRYLPHLVHHRKSAHEDVSVRVCGDGRS